MNEQLLEDIGLTKGEIKVYLTLLKLRETTTGKIIEEAQISSGKIYEILDKLIKKGLVSYIIKEHEINLFKGFKGIQTAIFEALEDSTEKDEVLAMGIYSSKEKQYNLLWQRWHKERIDKRITCKAIFSDKNTDYYKLFKKMKFTEVKVLEGITPSAVDIIGNRVLIFTYREEPSCLSIKNPE